MVLHPTQRHWGRLAGKRGDYLALLLTLLSALAYPIAVRMLFDFSPALAVYLPTIVFVVGVCLICPRPIIPGAVLLLVFAVQLSRILVVTDSLKPGLLHNILAGNYYLMGVPIAAIALGYAAILARRRMSLWPWTIKTNLRILAYRPILFIRAYRWPLLILLVGALFDTITTMNSMYSHGTKGELHPAIRAIVQQYGVTLGMPIGTIVRLGFVLFIAAIWRRWCSWVIFVCGFLYFLAALSNHYHWL